MARHTVTDEGDPRKYYAAIPNIVLRIGLNPYELSLYVYLKQVAGEAGVCWKSTATIAKDCRMSIGMVSKQKLSLATPRPELNGKALITIASEMQNGGNPNHSISITDIWPENMAELSRVREVKATRSLREGARSYSEPTRSRGGDKEEPIKNNPKELSAHAGLMAFHAGHLQGPIPDAAAQAGAVKWLLQNYTPEQCQQVYMELRSQEWRETPITWLIVRKEIGSQLQRAKEPKAVSPDAPFGYDPLGRKILSRNGGHYTIMGPDGTPSNRYDTPEAFCAKRGITLEQYEHGIKR